ncbi:MAG: amino acid ABC transporter substrate-binding protein [Chloroflexi bacterium]|nr:amino acid ABC transporter substrate-binding protein [Chloroflexota bacterium]
MRRTFRFVLALAVLLSFVALSHVVNDRNEKSAFAQAEPTGKLAEVLARGYLNCGISAEVPGFSYLNPNDNTYSGLDVDFCRALTAAIFGEVTDTNLVFVSLSSSERFPALQANQVDVLMRNTTWTFSRDTDLKGSFGPTTFYDGQGLMVPASLGVASIDDLNGASICVQTGTTTELNITEAFNSRGFDFELIPFDDAPSSIIALEAGQCDVLTTDKSGLAGLRSGVADPSLYVILPDTLSKEPLSPMYNEGDDQWANVVDWTVYATFQAEEYGITSANIDEMLASEDSAIQRFLGVGDPFNSLIGLSNDFTVNIIRTVGNYGEIYDRNIVPIGIPREGSLNALWTSGGLIYSPAWR